MTAGRETPHAEWCPVNCKGGCDDCLDQLGCTCGAGRERTVMCSHPSEPHGVEHPEGECPHTGRETPRYCVECGQQECRHVGQRIAAPAGRETPSRQDVAHALDLLRKGNNEPDTWTREQRAAVTRLHAYRDGRESPPARETTGEGPLVTSPEQIEAGIAAREENT